MSAIGPASHQPEEWNVEPETEPAAGPAAGPAPAQVGRAAAVAGRNPAAEAAVTRFYDAFVRHDFDAMEKIYAPGAKFQDEIFQYSDRAGTMKMWRGLLSKAEDMKTKYEILGSEGDTVRVRWTADYKFGSRPVHNEIEGTLKVRDGKIVEHRDRFDWDKWAKQALPLGPLSTNSHVRTLVTSLLRMIVD